MGKKNLQLPSKAPPTRGGWKGTTCRRKNVPLPGDVNLKTDRLKTSAREGIKIEERNS